MASSKEAFEKFRMWKNSRTVLKLTVLTNGGTPDIFMGRVAAVDEDSWQVSFAVSKDRSYRVITFVGASFLLGGRRLEAERSEEGNFLMCEEIG
jgi:electron transfer flavoprotein alpha/beta subunit